MDCNTPGLLVHCQLPEFTQTHVHWVGDAIQPSHPLSSPSPPALNLSQHQGLFQWVIPHIRWPKYWSFSFSISSSSEYSGLISLRIDWFDLLAVQGTLRSFLQHHSSKASILQHSAFFKVQLSHPYMPTGKTIALTRWAFVGKVMSLNTIEKIYIYTHMHTHIFIHTFYIYAIVQPLTCVPLFATLWTAARQASLSITNSQSLLKLMCIESVMPSNHLVLCRPLLLPSIFPSIRVFPSESALRISGQRTGVSASASALAKDTQDWSPLGSLAIVNSGAVNIWGCVCFFELLLSQGMCPVVGLLGHTSVFGF